jgi:5-hydroxyisourate hydrolase-like protein (transthyretin family)
MPGISIHVGDWYRAQRVSLPDIPFLDAVAYRLGA